MDCNLMAALKQLVNRKYSHILVISDFNLHALKSQATPGEQFKVDLQDLVSNYAPYSHVTTLTRFRGTDRPSMLDRIFTNEEVMVERVITDTPLGRSDHATLLFHYMCYADYPKEHAEEYHVVTNYEDLSDLIDTTSWSFLAELTSQVACEEFVNIFTKLVARTSETKLYRPKRMKSFVRSRTPSPNDHTWDVYTIQRNHCVKLVLEDKLKNQQGLMEKLCSNPKLLYRHVNNLRRVKRGIPALHTAYGLAQTAQEAANVLGQQLCRTFQSAQSSYILPKQITPPSGFNHISFTSAAVVKRLMSLREFSSPGADGIRPKTLKVAAMSLAGPLAIFFQRCLNEMHVPTMWKHGIIMPIYKSGSRAEPTNYRPITQLPVISKVMESIVAEALMGCLENNKMLVPEQHEFRQKRSCTTNILIAFANWTESVDAGAGVDAAYLDFSKAFDRIDHRILLHKLQKYGIGDPVLCLIRDFLVQRHLNVRVRGKLSESIEVRCGVPQGSVLGTPPVPGLHK
ncbi:unnamed protein product [Dicrocoelium dendriticum]|nr:unnamed protein product [Dicrocoelium dendriticum]